MSLCAINNALNNNVLARRFMSVPEVRANEQLLFENMPVDPIRIKTYESEIFREPHAARNADEFVRIIKKRCGSEAERIAAAAGSIYSEEDKKPGQSEKRNRNAADRGADGK